MLRYGHGTGVHPMKDVGVPSPPRAGRGGGGGGGVEEGKRMLGVTDPMLVMLGGQGDERSVGERGLPRTE